MLRGIPEQVPPFREETRQISFRMKISRPIRSLSYINLEYSAAKNRQLKTLVSLRNVISEIILLILFFRMILRMKFVNFQRLLIPPVPPVVVVKILVNMRGRG